MSNFIIENGNEKFIDIVKILPDNLPSGKRIYWKDFENGKIKIFCDRYGIRGGTPAPIIINRHVPICELLFEGLGLWAGDGIKRKLGEFCIFGFGNSELELHKHFTNFSKLFGLEESNFKCRISVPTKYKKNIYKIEKNVSQKLCIPLKNFLKGDTNDTRNYIYVDIFIQLRLLSLTIKNLHDILRDIILSDKTFAAAYIKGVIASEGSIYNRIRENNQVGEINIAAQPKEERELYRKILNFLEIQPSKDKTIPGDEAVLIHGRTNFEKVAKWKLADLHPKKKEKFWQGLKNFKSRQFRKGEGNLLIMKSLLERPKSAVELAKELKINLGTVKTNHLWKLIDKSFVEYKEKKKIKRWWTKFYEITEDGKIFLSSTLP